MIDNAESPDPGRLIQLSPTMFQYLPQNDEEWTQLIEQVESEVNASNHSSSSVPFAEDNRRALARTIDHTLLKLDATEEQIDKLCQEARKYRFKVAPPFPTPSFSQLGTA